MTDAHVESHVIRKLRRADEPAFAAHLKRLDPENRRLRFGMAVNDAFLDDHAAGTLEPPFPTPFSVFDEQLRDAQSLLATLLGWAR